MGGGGQAGRHRKDSRHIYDSEFRRAVDALKGQLLLSGVAGKALKLQKSGREYKACCPFHSERTPSFTVNDALSFAHCFGCGWHGDVIRVVMDMERCDFRDAYRRLASDDLPTWTPQERTKAEAEERLERLADERDAQRFYKESVPYRGTPAEAYLRARGITAELPDCIRFGQIPSWRSKETGEWGRKHPALICGCANGTGEIVGIQRIFFEGNDPSLGKARCKLSLGTIRGSALRLGPPADTIMMAEGPEDGMSLHQEGAGIPVWVPFGTSMMPQVQLPSIVRKVIIAGQNNTAGRVAVNKAAIAMAERGLDVEYVWPAAEFDDWNDWLKALNK